MAEDAIVVSYTSGYGFDDGATAHRYVKSKKMKSETKKPIPDVLN